MKRFLLLILLLFYSYYSFGQLIKGESPIRSNSQIIINGDLTNTADQIENTFKVSDTLVVHGNIVNQSNTNPFFFEYLTNKEGLEGTPSEYDALIIFKGDSIITNLTNNEEVFYHLLIDNSSSDSIKLFGDIRVNYGLELINGKLFLGDSKLHLFNKSTEGLYALIINEDENNLIFNGQSKLGYVFTIVNEGFDTFPIDDNMGLSSSSTNGFTGIRLERYHYRENDVSDGGIKRVFKLVDMGSELSGEPLDELTLKYLDYDIDTFNLDENNFGPWVNKETNNRWFSGWDSESTRDPSNNEIQGFETINYIADRSQTFTIAEVDCDSVPLINLGSDTIFLCDGNEAILSPEYDLSGLELLWSTGDVTNSITVSQEDTFILEVWDISGCYNADTVFVDIKPIPEPLIGFEGGHFACEGSPISFKNYTDTAVYVSPTLEQLEKMDTIGHQYTWYFNDPNTPGAFSTLFEQEYTYDVHGVFRPELIVESRFGCKDTTEASVIIKEIPEASFVANNLCEGDSLQLTNTSSTEGASGSHDYQWKRSDTGETFQSTEFTELPEWLLANSGNYNIELIVGLNGCYDTTSSDFIVLPRPDVTIDAPDSICLGVQVLFSNTTTIDSGLIEFYAWDFGDGSNSGLETPRHTYNSPGLFKVLYTTGSLSGCQVKDSLEIEVVDLPDVSFSLSANEICFGDTVQADVLNFSNQNSYSWSAGPFTGTDNPFRFRPDATGTYTVQLSATSSIGCANTSTQTINASSLPVASFTIEDACSTDELVVNNTSNISSGFISSYIWSWDDGTYATERNPVKAYTAPGQYEVGLRVTSDKGCVGDFQQTIEIHDAPDLNIPTTLETCGDEFYLNAGPANLTYLWYDNSTQSDYTFTNSGAYWVKASSAEGCESTYEFDVLLNTILTPDFGSETEFCDSTTLDAQYPGSTYLWSDGSTDRFLTITESGNYSVTLTDQNGCEAFTEIDLFIHNTPIVDLGEDLTVCAYEPIVLDAGTGGTQYLWNDAPGGQQYSVTQTGLYHVQVIGEGSCKAEDYIFVEYNEQPVINVPANLMACDQISIDAGEGYSSYRWSNGETSRIVQLFDSQILDLIVSNSNGCADTSQIEVVINQSPVFDLGPDQEHCFGTTAYLISNYPFDNGSYYWSTGETTEDIFVNSSGAYKLTITTPENCSSTDSVDVTIYPSLTVDFPQEQMVCRGQDALIEGGDPENFYTWYFEDSLIVERSNQNNLTISEPGFYIVEVENAIGCSDTDTIRAFETTNIINAEFLVASVANAGDSLQLIQLTDPSPEWFQWHFGDGDKSYDYHPQKVYFVPGDYEITLAVRNEVCKDTARKVISILPLNIDVNEDLGQSGIEDYFTEILEFSVYPNPTTGTFNVKMKMNREVDVHMVLIDLNGKKVDEFDSKGEQLLMEVDLHAKPDGMYILKSVVDSQIVREHKIVKH